MGLRNEQAEEIEIANEHMEKMSILTSHQRNTSPNYWEIPFYPSQNVSQKENKQQMLHECGQKGALMCWWQYKLVQSL